MGSPGSVLDLDHQVVSLKLRLEVLGRSQQSALRRVAPLVQRRGFYLAGGTGLALQLGHRRSVDVDWFRLQPIEDPLRLAAAMHADGLALRIDRVEEGTLHARVGEVRFSFFEYRYPLLKPALEAQGLTLAALEDVAAMKLAAVAQRGSKKDFVDIYALGRRYGLREMLDLYRRKYGVADVGHVLVALAYFDDADRERMPTLLRRRWDWSTMKATIRRWVADTAG